MRTKLLYEGKAKKVFSIEDQLEYYLVEFKNSLTAFNAQKKGSFEGKGKINRDITSLIFEYLNLKGIPTHWVKNEGETSMIVRPVEIFPAEVVVRNLLAGSTAKRFGRSEGLTLKRPLVEFYYKNDTLEDPLMTEEQAELLGLVEATVLAELKEQALKINQHLQSLYLEAGMILVDFKVEFGRDLKTKQIILADEISPDCCRLWDTQTKEKMDKDRFRRDLGQVDEMYKEVCRRLTEVVKRGGRA